jgi:hypothetical protein
LDDIEGNTFFAARLIFGHDKNKMATNNQVENNEAGSNIR